MNKKIIRLAACLFLGSTVASALGQPTPAPADKLPAGAAGYVGWGGAGPQKAALDKTGLVRLLNDPEVKPYVDAGLRQLERFIGCKAAPNLRPDVYPQLKAVVLEAVWQRPWAGCSMGPEEPANDSLAWALAGQFQRSVLVFDLGEQAEPMMGRITALLNATLPPDERARIRETRVSGVDMTSFTSDDTPPMTVLWGVHKKHLLVASSEAMAVKTIAVMDGKAPSLAGDARFRAVSAKVGGLLTAYMDVTWLARSAVLAGGQGAATQPELSRTVAALGMDAVDWVGFSIGPEGGDFVTRTYISAPRGKPGLLRLFDQKPLDRSLLTVAPADATFLLAGNLDRVKLLDELERQLAKFPSGQADYNKAKAGIEKVLGMPVRELAEAVGDGVVVFNSPSSGGFLVTGLTVVAEVNDAAKVRQAVETLEKMLRRQSDGNAGRAEAPAVKPAEHQPHPNVLPMTMISAGQFEVKEAEFGKHRYHYLHVTGLPVPVAPAWCVTDKHLVVSLFPQSLRAALGRLEAGEAGSVLGNERFAAMSAGNKEASHILYVNNQQLIRTVYPLLPAVWQLACSAAANEGMDLDVNALPRQATLLANLGDTFTAVVPDAGGVLLVDRGPSPVDGIVKSIYANAPLTFPILLSSMEEGRRGARRAKSASNLCLLARAAITWSNEHDGRWPDSLEQAVEDMKVQPDVLKSPSQAGPGESYVYLKPGREGNIPNFSTHVVAYERPEINGNEGTNVLYFDGHVEWVTMERFRRELENTLKANAGK